VTIWGRFPLGTVCGKDTLHTEHSVQTAYSLAWCSVFEAAPQARSVFAFGVKVWSQSLE